MPSLMSFVPFSERIFDETRTSMFHGACFEPKAFVSRMSAFHFISEIHLNPLSATVRFLTQCTLRHAHGFRTRQIPIRAVAVVYNVRRVMYNPPEDLF
jgi:hypothetical protein